MLRVLFLILTLLLPSSVSSARTIHGNGATTYTGLVASRARMFTNQFGTGSSQSMSRSGHISGNSPITSLQLVIANWQGGNPDVSLGVTQTVTLSIEYPAGTCTQVKFSGIATGTNPDFGTLVSDSLTIAIPAITTFWVRQWTSGGTYFNPWNSSFFGEYYAAGASETDATVSCASLTGSAVSSQPPLAIIGPTNQPTVTIVGDSIGAGLNDTENSNGSTINGLNGKIGAIADSIQTAPFLNLSISGMLANTWIAQSPGKKNALKWSSHIASEIGANDFNSSRTSAQLIADLHSIWAFGTGSQKIFTTTITPATSSTDAWATVGNQTSTPAGAASEKAIFNTAARAGTISGTAGFYDIDSVYDNSLNGDIWKPNLTPDGVHPANPTIYQLIVGAGVVAQPVYP